MHTLIICIDRDNDLGAKAGVVGPIIGRANNIEAAIRLASVDPEDSDTNTIFGGISLYDKLISENIEVEIISITGDEKVGVISDKKISEQLDRIIEKLKPERSILVSDGAEDESVLPLIQSRIKIDAVHRIIVKQHENLESTYYIIKKAFNDPKISHTFFMPIGLVFLIYAISLYANRPEIAIIAITAAIGIYMLYRGTGLDDAVSEFRATMEKSLHTGKIIFVMYLAAIILSIIGTVEGSSELWNYYNYKVTVGYLVLLMSFLNASIWWYVIAGLLISAGKIIDMRLAKEKIGRNLAHPLFIISAGILLWAGSTSILVNSEAVGGYPLFESGQRFIISAVMGAILVGGLGAWISTRTKSPRTRGSKT